MIANFSQLIIALFILFSAVFSLPKTAYAQTQNSPVLVELFTSERCPACPAADRIFNELLNENPDTLAVSCHVTYFNRGTRTDHLSRPFCDARQNIYKLALKTGGIFTPMSVINGQSFIKGKDKQKLKTLIKQHQTPIYRSVGLQQNGQYLDISLPQMPITQNADVWLFEIKKTDGRFRNSVVNITKLLRWQGRKMNMAFPVRAPDPNIGYALIVQNYKNGVITSAKTGF